MHHDRLHQRANLHFQNLATCGTRLSWALTAPPVVVCPSYKSSCLCVAGWSDCGEVVATRMPCYTLQGLLVQQLQSPI